MCVRRKGGAEGEGKMANHAVTQYAVLRDVHLDYTGRGRRRLSLGISDLE